MSDKTENEVLLRVSSRTAVDSLASAIANNVYVGNVVTLRAIGNGAVGQSVKGIAAAQAFTAPRGITLSARPAFTEVEVSDKTVSAIILRIIATR